MFVDAHKCPIWKLSELLHVFNPCIVAMLHITCAHTSERNTYYLSCCFITISSANVINVVLLWTFGFSLGMVTTLPMLITQCKAPKPPATEVKLPSLEGKTQCGTYGHAICSGCGGKHQTHLQQVWNTDLLQSKQDLQTASSKAQGPLPSGKQKWCYILLPIWSHWLWRRIHWRDFKDHEGMV